MEKILWAENDMNRRKLLKYAGTGVVAGGAILRRNRKSPGRNLSCFW